MVKASEACRSDDVFVPQWKYYEQLMFLRGCWDRDGSPDDQPPSPASALRDDARLVVSALRPLAPLRPAPSSCLPSNAPVKCSWTEERERMLIAFYSEHDCLWRKKSENFNNRQLRLRLLEALRSQLSDPSASFSVEDLKCKFKNLRTVFNREYKAVQAGRVADKLHVSKWKHFQQLLFLCESCDEDEGPDDVQILTPREDRDPDRGNQMSSSALSGSSHGSAQIKFGDPSADSGDAYQVFLPASPVDLKPASQTAAAAFAASPPPADARPCAAPPPLDFSASVKTDGRLSADSRCHWNEAKVQQLISFYSEHSCLWNHKSESYRNRLLRQSLLETLSGLLSDHEAAPFAVEDIKTKFRNLRTIFQREHKVVSANRTCGSEDFYLPKWKHYRELMFLCDSCDEDERPGDLHFHAAQEPRLLGLDGQALGGRYHGTNQTAGQQLSAASLRSLKTPPSPTPPDSQHSSPSSSPSTRSSRADSRASAGRKRAGRCLAPPSAEVLDFIRAFCHSHAAPHAGFLKYVEECLNDTPPDKVRKLKKKIIETIHSVSEEG
ncbi:uncharacterized protein [Clinocottus analis]